MADTDNRPDPAQEARTVDAAATESLLAAVAAKTEELGIGEEQSELAKGVVKLFGERLRGVKINKDFFNAALNQIDALIGAQLDEVLHHEKFQQLESAWTSLKWLTDRTDFNQNIRFELLSVSKSELLQDFQDASETTTSGLYQNIYSSQYGAPNGKPYGCMVLNYEFSHRAPDVELLGKVAEVASMAHAPVLSAVSPDLFGPKGFDQLSDANFDVKQHFSQKEFAKWNGFREDENAKLVGLTMPRYLLRIPYNEKENPVDEKEFKYQENVHGNSGNYLWGNAAFALMSRVTQSFKDYRWCWRVVGEESGGLIADMKMHTYTERGEVVQKPPVSAALDFRRETLLNEAGLIPLMWLREKDQSVFYGVPSFKQPLRYPDTPEGRKNEADEALRSRLQYMFILTRFAHYLKRLETKYIGAQKSKDDILDDLSKWVRQYVNAAKIPGELMGKFPLRSAEVFVQEDEKSPGTFICEFRIVPHTLVEGFSTTLSLVSRQDLGK